MNVAELQKKAIECIERLPAAKLSSAIDYLEFLIDKEESELSDTERLAMALVDVAKDKEGKINLPKLGEFLNELRD